MSVTRDEARRELARREIARRAAAMEPPPFNASPGLPPGLEGYLGNELPKPTLAGFGSAVRGAGEGLVDMFGKAAGGLAGGIAAAPLAFDEVDGVPTGRDKAMFDMVSEKFSAPFRPRTREGELSSGALSMPFEMAERGADYLGEKTPGGPMAQTGMKTALLGLPAFLGPAKNLRKSVGEQGLRNASLVPRKPLSMQQTILKEAQDAGYVAPSSTANPSSYARGAFEGVFGKPRLEQHSAYRNQANTNRLVAEEIGLPPDTPVTLASLDKVREIAGQKYQVLSEAGTITPTIVFRRELASAVSGLRSAAADFPVLAKAEGPVANAIEMARGFNVDSFQASSVIEATKILRDEASSAYRAGHPTVGNAYRKISDALENAAERHLDNFGDPTLVQAFRDARVQIAKTYSIEKALDGDGFVNAHKLASQRGKRTPLTGNLDLIARFAEQYPKLTKLVKETPIEQGRLSGMMGAAGAGTLYGSGQTIPAGLFALLTYGSPAARALILSKLGQETLAKPVPAASYGGAASGIAASGLLSDQPE